MSWQRRSISVAVLVALVGCQQRVIQDQKAARIAIDRTNSGLVRWIAAGDLDSLAAVFVDSAWQFPIGMPPVIGRKAVRGYWANALRWGSWRYTLAADTVDVEGHLAIERGHYSLIFTAGPEAPLGTVSSADHGHYLTAWRQGEDGVWRIQWTAPVSEVPPMVDVKQY
jgi:ketosteroid isomerase-like protein